MLEKSTLFKNVTHLVLEGLTGGELHVASLGLVAAEGITRVACIEALLAPPEAEGAERPDVSREALSEHLRHNNRQCLKDFLYGSGGQSGTVRYAPCQGFVGSSIGLWWAMLRFSSLCHISGSSLDLIALALTLRPPMAMAISSE